MTHSLPERYAIAAFAAFWTLIVGAIGISVFLRAVQETAPVRAVPTPATVAEVVVDDWEYRGRPRHGIAVRYVYAVDGRTHEGRIDPTADGLFGQSADDVARVAARFPVGAPLTVYRSPDNPGWSAPDRFPRALDALHALFFAPFVAGAVLMWAKAVGRPAPDGDDRPTTADRVFLASFCAAVASLVGVFVIRISIGVRSLVAVPLPELCAAWAAALVAAACGWAKGRWRGRAKVPRAIQYRDRSRRKRQEKRRRKA